MIEKISIPTDNFYKTLFFMGLGILILSLVPLYNFYNLKIQNIRFDGEMSNLKNSQKWLQEDSNEYEIKFKELKILKKGNFRELLKLDHNSEEYKNFIESTSNIGGSDNSNQGDVFLVDIQKFKQENEKRNKHIQEIENKLNETRKTLISTARDIEISKIQIKTKKAEINANSIYIVNQIKMSLIGAFIGISAILYGSYCWLTKTQKYQNKIQKIRSC